MRLYLLSMAIAALPGQTLAQPPVELPTTRIIDCTTGECHTSQLQYEFLHGPAAVVACDTCHEYDDPAVHTFKYKREGREMCDFCHIDKVGTQGLVAHEPIVEGDCLACHDPHGAKVRKLLKADGVGELCMECHEEVGQEDLHAHEPFGKGECLSCHAAHTAWQEKLLIEPSRTLCLRCHEQTRQELADACFVHDPMKDDCLQCHAAHSSSDSRQLAGTPEAICTSCHEKIEALAITALHEHSIMFDGESCLNCHSAHTGQTQSFLRNEPVQVCLECHQDPIALADGSTVGSVGLIAESHLLKHGPVGEGKCSECHGVHGADYADLLIEPYKSDFYGPFSLERYGLCFECHDVRMVLDEQTTEMTKFRNGNQNLHFVHISSGRFGRSCSVCHTTHVSELEMQLQTQVPFGNWDLPIAFKRTISGGSCAPGCHKPTKYDWIPVPGESDAPLSRSLGAREP